MNIPFVENNKVPELSTDTAEQMLQNVLEAGQMPPSSIPLEVLISYSNYRKERFAFQKLILLIILILFCLIPLLFIYPEFEITLHSDPDTYPPVYTFSLDTSFPLKSVDARLNDKELPVSQIKKSSFTLTPTDNGLLQVTAVLKNNQFHKETLEINTVDTKAPVYETSTQDKERFYLYVSDNLSGIDYEHITATDTMENPVPVDSYDEEKGCIVFLYPETTLNVYIPDMAGNTLHLILNVS